MHITSNPGSGPHPCSALNRRRISPKYYRNFTPPRAILSTLPQPMKRAFVIRLSPDTNPEKGKFQGHVEEVDTGRELKFRSVDEFLVFVQECMVDGSSGG